MTLLRSAFGDSGMFAMPGVPGIATGNKGAFARFERVAVKNEKKSTAAGSAIYQEEIHVTILMPGDTLSAPRRRVRLADGTVVGPEWIEGYPREWAAFEEGREQVPDGTPLDQWPPCDIALRATLKARHIHTVEMLAHANDAALEGIGMGARELQAKARAFLDVAANSAAAMRHAAENEAAQAAMADMTKRMQEMERQLAMMTRAGQVMIGNAMGEGDAASPAPVMPAPPVDEMSAAALASGAVPISDLDLAAVSTTRRGPGRPPKHG